MNNLAKIKILALTGGIGAGKSTVGKIFKQLGSELISADSLAREIVLPGMPAHKEIQAKFGSEYLNEDQSLNRKKLGALIFSDKEARKNLEKITHPKIRSLFEDKVKKAVKSNPI